LTVVDAANDKACTSDPAVDTSLEEVTVTALWKVIAAWHEAAARTKVETRLMVFMMGGSRSWIRCFLGLEPGIRALHRLHGNPPTGPDKIHRKISACPAAATNRRPKPRATLASPNGAISPMNLHRGLLFPHPTNPHAFRFLRRPMITATPMIAPVMA
jgi:hypothetical protein